MLQIIILAAGRGTRMKSSLPKVLHPLGGRAMINHVLDKAKKLGAESMVVVIGHQAETMREHYKGKHSSKLMFSSVKLGQCGVRINVEGPEFC